MKEFNPYFSATVVSQYAVRRVATSGKIKVGLRWVFLHPKHELPRHTPLPSRRGHGKLHIIAGVPHCWNGGGPSCYNRSNERLLHVCGSVECGWRCDGDGCWRTESEGRMRSLCIVMDAAPQNPDACTTTASRHSLKPRCARSSLR